MPPKSKKISPQVKKLPKSPTGISGLDEIPGAGFPRGGPTWVAAVAARAKSFFLFSFFVVVP